MSCNQKAHTNVAGKMLLYFCIYFYYEDVLAFLTVIQSANSKFNLVRIASCGGEFLHGMHLY